MKPRLLRGFTLIELIVAIFIAAIVFALGYGGVNQALRDRDALSANQARLNALQTAVRVLVQDFSQVAPRPVRDPVGSSSEPVLRTDAAAIVVFTRMGWANPAGVQRSALQRVRYVLEDHVLRREHWRVLDATLDSQPVRRDLLDRVQAIKLRFMDGAREWRADWPPAGVTPGNAAALRTLPLAVEITLDLEDYGTVMRVVEVPG
ncbi:MAG: type II secretion system minor pseudopilin GspJ [Steroidobacteraceae bacterium]